MALDVAVIAVRGRWLKHTYPGSPALPEREPPPDNRWQRGEVVDAVYLADSEDTVCAEWYRHLAERAIPPLAQMPRELWTWEVDVEVADLSTRERLTAVGLSSPRRNPEPGQGDLTDRFRSKGNPQFVMGSQVPCVGRGSTPFSRMSETPAGRRLAFSRGFRSRLAGIA